MSAVAGQDHKEIGQYAELMQSLELQADAAALSNLMARVVRYPDFGMGIASDQSPVAVIGEVGAAVFLALIALEARRKRQSYNREIWHPFPTRRISSMKRLIQWLEASGHLPSGAEAAINGRLSMVRNRLSGMYGSHLLDMAVGHIVIPRDDTDRLEYLIDQYSVEIKNIEASSFVPDFV